VDLETHREKKAGGKLDCSRQLKHEGQKCPQKAHAWGGGGGSVLGWGLGGWSGGRTGGDLKTNKKKGVRKEGRDGGKSDVSVHCLAGCANLRYKALEMLTRIPFRYR